jgi:4-hydroxy-3-methylbut-2-enyl diphosphate reductase
MIKKIVLAKPRGFCAGVKRALEIVETSLKKHGSPIYVYHEIVHNEHVVNALKHMGVEFVHSIDDVPEKNILIFSAHGTPDKLIQEAKEKGLEVIDAACPLVKKVHQEARYFNQKGHDIILIGKKNHQEVIGTMSYAPIHLVSSVDDVYKLDSKEIDETNLVFLTQTTLSVNDTQDIIAALKNKFPLIAARNDICFATQNRQDAVRKLSSEVDMILVVGSITSSNSNSLAKQALKYCDNSHLILDKTELRDDWFSNVKKVGITAGASTSEAVVKDIVDFLNKKNPNLKIEEKEYVVENIEFK